MRVITIDADTKERVYSRKEVADLVGISTQTLRLWEDAGVIPQSVRDDKDYRYWLEADIAKIKEYAELPLKDRRKNNIPTK